MSTSDSVAIRTCPIACVPVELRKAVLLVHGLGVAEVLHDLERVPEREHLRLGNVFDEVGEVLEVAVVLERDPEGVRRLLLGLLVSRAERGKPRLDLDAVPTEAVLEVEVARACSRPRACSA